MARGQGTVTVRFLGETRDLDRAFDKVNGGLSKVGGAFATMGKAAAVGIGLAAAAAVPFGIKAVQMASDVEESLSKVNSVFGESGKTIDRWARGAATSIGLSRGEALDAAGTFGNMFTQLGIASAKAADMSTSIVGLAADFASFHNADITEVIAAQSAAFRGEYDSLQRFLPLINAATVEQKAMAMTGKANAKELTAQEKALAVNALMFEGAGKAAGDFARTSDGLANQMRILKARAADFAAQVGSVLLPIVLRGLNLFGDLTAQLRTAFEPAMALAKRAVGAFEESFQGAGLNTSTNPLIRLAGVAGDALHRFTGQIKSWRDTAVPMFEKVEATSGEVFANITKWFEQHRDKFEAIWGQIVAVVGSAVGAVRAVIVTAADFLRGVWRVFGDDLISFTREFFAGVLEAVRAALNVLKGIFDLIKAVLTGKWGDAWNALKAIVDGAWDLIFAVVRNAVTNVIPTIIAGLGQLVTSAGRTAFDGLREAFRGVMNWIIDRWNGLEFKMPAVDTPFGKIGGFTLGGPDIPRLARGGLFSGAALVGEKGPELLVGNRTGRVVPNDQLGGITINVHGALDPVGVARQIQSLLLQEKRRSGALGLS